MGRAEDHLERVVLGHERRVRTEGRGLVTLQDRVPPANDRQGAVLPAHGGPHAVAVRSIASERLQEVKHPEGVRKGPLAIICGRHPILECDESAPFSPNSTFMSEYHTLEMVFGPNGGGKTTYLRQTAQLVLLAQAGSFV